MSMAAARTGLKWLLVTLQSSGYGIPETDVPPQSRWLKDVLRQKPCIETASFEVIGLSESERDDPLVKR
ncbi:hypothetical protein BDQ17DRAFT_1426750 [Cyathus striatus]|nr:hypothetical protein BDQ17DRAFT_1426750 [Cyathus striatus]